MIIGHNILIYLTNRTTLSKSLLSIAAYVLDIKNTYIIDTVRLSTLTKELSTFRYPERRKMVQTSSAMPLAMRPAAQLPAITGAIVAAWATKPATNSLPMAFTPTSGKERSY